MYQEIVKRTQVETPSQFVSSYTERAEILKSIIDSKGVFSLVKGKRYVRVEGWTTLAAMLGFLPKEISVEEKKDGSYIAKMALVRLSDGVVYSEASAECGMDEKEWKSRPAFARRSMAITRATSKVCRIAFSWVMVLAGYEATPAEEIHPMPTEQWEPSPKLQSFVFKLIERAKTSQKWGEALKVVEERFHDDEKSLSWAREAIEIEGLENGTH